MSAYIIVDIDVHDPDTYAGYVARAPGFVEQYGGRYLVRGGNTTVAEGDWSPSRLVVVEFPSRERAEAFLADPGYRQVAALRQSATTSRLIVADGA